VIQGDPLLAYQLSLSRELGMTLKRLVQEIGPGEIALQIAYDDIEMNRRSKAKADAERRAQRSAGLRQVGW
jgi:hypothetical protein